MAEVKRRRKTAVAGIAPSEPERDILDQYLYEVSTFPLLKGTEEIEVARRIRAGDPDALQELVQRNLDECVLCRLCLDASPQGAVKIIKLYDGGAAL